MALPDQDIIMSKKNINISNLIDLASFKVSADEKEMLEKEIEDFLEYAEVINNAPIKDLQPSSHAIDKKVLYRDDSEKNWEHLDAMLNNGPHVDNTSYIVPPLKGQTGTEKKVDENLTLKSESDYEVVIGLEVHAQLRTKTKLFCKCSTEFGKDPNENTCPVCTGQPGALPVLNKEAVKMAILAGIAVGCKINTRSVFDRKNYFYPDLPKGYQISQFEEPICSEGSIEIQLNGERKRISLNRIHLEEDAGKMVHVGAPGIWGSKASAVDYNRSSVPLIEIVSEPHIRSATEAREYVVMLRSILVSLSLCDGNLEEGSLRCDANISLRQFGDKELGVKTEIKNMNSFKAIERALEFEIERQKRIKHLGQEIQQETRLWDESSQKTYTMRSKEESHDYRYFPDPDLIPLILDEEIINEQRTKLKELPLERMDRFKDKYSFSDDEARLLTVNPRYGDYFEEILNIYNNPRTAANWFLNELLSFVAGDIRAIHVAPQDFAGFLQKIESGEISGKIGKIVLKKSFDSGKGLNDIINEEGLKQISDQEAIEAIVVKILEENKDQVKSFKDGKTKVFGFLVGQIMKETKGKANPQIVNEILKKKIDEV